MCAHRRSIVLAFVGAVLAAGAGAAGAACTGEDPDTVVAPPGNDAATNIDTGVVGDDSGTNGPSVGGELHFLQPNKAVTLANGAEQLTVVANGAFAFKKATTPGEPYDVSVAKQPDGQHCWVRDGVGVFGAGPGGPKVRCTVALQSSSGTGPDIQTDQQTYQPIAEVKPLTFANDVATKALVSVVVPFVGPTASNQSYLVSLIDITLDGTQIAKGQHKAAYYSYPGAITIVTVVDVPAGSHTLAVSWMRNGSSATATIQRVAPTLLTATLLDSLSIHLGTTFGEAGISNTSKSTTTGYTHYGVPDTTIDLPSASPVLVTSLAPYPYGDRTRFRIQLDPQPEVPDAGVPEAGASDTLAEGFFFDQSQTISLFGLPTIGTGKHTFAALWRTEPTFGCSFLDNARATVTATAFSPDAFTVFKSEVLANVSTKSTSLVPVNALSASFNAPRAGKMLVFLQPTAAFTAFGVRGELALVYDGTPIASSFAASQGDANPAYPHDRPLSIITLVDVSAGPHTLGASIASADANVAMSLTNGRANLGAILLE